MNLIARERSMWKKALGRVMGRVWNRYSNLGRMSIMRTFIWLNHESLRWCHDSSERLILVVKGL